MIRFSEIASCKNTNIQLIEINNNATLYSFVGDLSVLFENQSGLILLKLADFQYGIKQNQIIIYEDKDPEFQFIFCLNINQQRYWLVKIKENGQLIHSILSQKCRLFDKKASKLMIDKINQESTRQNMGQQNNYPASNPRTNQVRNDHGFNNHNIMKSPSLTQSTQVFLANASYSLSEGLIKAERLFSQGKAAFGAFLSKNNEFPKSISLQGIKKMIKDSTDKSKDMITMNAQKFEELFRMKNIQNRNNLAYNPNNPHINPESRPDIAKNSGPKQKGIVKEEQKQEQVIDKQFNPTKAVIKKL